MKCSHYFKDKFRSKGRRSAPGSREERKPEEYSGPDQTVKSPFLALLYYAEALLVISIRDIRLATVALGASTKGHKEWLAEVQFLGVLEHPNVIKLIGHCAVDGERGIHRFLVYEFMQNKSLEDHLFSHAFPPLPWKTRLQIMLGAARALAYLHEGLEVQVIHRNFKASTVLLDEKFNPKLSDFGLAMAGDTHATTRVMGTYGYAAPEFLATGHLPYKSDVWSFGGVLYEILSGMRLVDVNRPTSEHSLVEWVKRFPDSHKRMRSIMDPRLENQYSIGAACKIAKLANACLSSSPEERPKMSEVVKRLKHIIQVSGKGTAVKMKYRPEASKIETKNISNNQGSESLKRQMTHITKESIQDEDANELLTIKYALETFLKAERKGKVVLIVESDSAAAVKWIEDYKSRPRKLWDTFKESTLLFLKLGLLCSKFF
ncbi:hypothetical protein V6N13_086808 [Hibiscus sabdariffa]